MVSFCWQLDTDLESPGKWEPQQKNCQDQTSPWPHLWGIFFWLPISVREHTPLRAVTPLGRWAWALEERQLNMILEASQQAAFFHGLSSRIQDPPEQLSWPPSVMDYSVEEQSPTRPFLLPVAFDECFCHHNRSKPERGGWREAHLGWPWPSAARMKISCSQLKTWTSLHH